MPLSNDQTRRITELLSEKVEKKLASYGRETTSMPFLSRLMQDNEKIAAYSFIHSLATTLGMSVYEEVSVIIASDDFLIGDQYWNFIGGENTFPMLLDVFNTVGLKYKKRLNEKFIAIAKEKLDSY